MKSLRSYLVSCAGAFSRMTDYAVTDRVLVRKKGYRTPFAPGRELRYAEPGLIEGG